MFVHNRFGRHFYKLLLVALVFINISFHPSLSIAQPQGSMVEENMKHNQSTLCLQGCISEEATRPGKVLIMGDSLSAAYGLEVEQGWVALLQKQFASNAFINASISGETTSGGKQRLTALLQKHQPQFMILELGANDALRGQNLNVTKRNLQDMIDACPKFNKDCKVILLGVQLPTNYGPVYDGLFQKMYRDLAEKNGLLFDPFFIEPVALDPDLMQSDGLHPNANAQPIIAERIAKLLADILKVP